MSILSRSFGERDGHEGNVGEVAAAGRAGRQQLICISKAISPKCPSKSLTIAAFILLYASDIFESLYAVLVLSSTIGSLATAFPHLPEAALDEFLKSDRDEPNQPN